MLNNHYSRENQKTKYFILIFSLIYDISKCRKSVKFCCSDASLISSPKIEVRSCLRSVNVAPLCFVLFASVGTNQLVSMKCV